VGLTEEKKVLLAKINEFCKNPPVLFLLGEVHVLKDLKILYEVGIEGDDRLYVQTSYWPQKKITLN